MRTFFKNLISIIKTKLQAKTFQYSGITILGVEGVKRFKQKFWFSRKK